MALFYHLRAVFANHFEDIFKDGRAHLIMVVLYVPYPVGATAPGRPTLKQHKKTGDRGGRPYNHIVIDTQNIKFPRRDQSKPCEFSARVY